MTNGVEGTVPQTSAVAMRAPPFWSDDPAMWFAQLESQFVMANISRDSVKFHAVTSALEQRYAVVVRDIILNPPADGKYELLKTELIRRFSASQESRIKQLLQHEEIGDRTPSQFLRHMRGLGGTSFTDEVMKTLWLGRLPLRMQDILVASSTTSLDAMALLADKIGENSAVPSHVASVDPPPTTSIQDQLNELCRQVAAIASNQRPRSPRRYFSSQGQEATSSEPKDDNMCWFHRTFGERAKQCRQPCSYRPKNSTGRK